MLVPRYFLPAEDAVILFQYSRNLAQHGAITFIPGGAHVEGATDFAWMVLISAATRCGIPPYWFCAAANVVSLVALALVLVRIAGMRLSRSGLAARILAIAGAAALFRQIFAAASGFAVLPDALLLTTLVLFLRDRRAAPASVTALLFCLFRPDAVVIAVPLLAYLLLEHKARPRTALAVTALFLIPGGLYFLWRWHYFGEFFPLPFLVKADFHREFGFLIAGSVRASLVPLLFTAVVLAPITLLKKQADLRLAIPLIAIPTLFYWTVRLDQNVGSRFFYYLPAACAILIAVHWPALHGRRELVLRTAFLAWLVLFAAPLYRESLTFRFMQFTRVKNIAEDLSNLPRHGTILTSEAGFLPYYSGWTAIDAWGLNTPEFAHRFFQRSDVARIHADLLVLHPDVGESCIPRPDWLPNYRDRSWPHLTRNLIEGADRYELWLTSYGSEFYQNRKHWRPGEGDRECWLVREDSPLRSAIEQTLVAHGGVPPPQATLLEQQRQAPAP